jgi:hypothetical protein
VTYKRRVRHKMFFIKFLIGTVKLYPNLRMGSRTSDRDFQARSKFSKRPNPSSVNPLCKFIFSGLANIEAPSSPRFSMRTSAPRARRSIALEQSRAGSSTNASGLEKWLRGWLIRPSHDPRFRQHLLGSRGIFFEGLPFLDIYHVHRSES